MKTRHDKPLFLIDIAVPRDIEARVNALDDVYLYNIDDLKGVASANLDLRRREIESAERMVEDAVGEFQGWLESLAARPTMERFEGFLGEVLEKEIRLSLERAGITSLQEREIREALSSRIRAKLMHGPLEKIKEASKNGGSARYLEALSSLFRLDEKESQPKP